MTAYIGDSVNESYCKEPAMIKGFLLYVNALSAFARSVRGCPKSAVSWRESNLEVQ